MPAWEDPDRWQAICDPAGCPICADGPQDVLLELDSTWVTAPVHAALPGYACVVSKQHVVEPWELPDRGAAFWADAMQVAEALKTHVDAVKMNYEIHGNTIPHLHLHLYPRFRGDPHEGLTIDGRSTVFERSPDDLQRVPQRAEEHVPIRNRVKHGRPGRVDAVLDLPRVHVLLFPFVVPGHPQHDPFVFVLLRHDCLVIAEVLSWLADLRRRSFLDDKPGSGKINFCGLAHLLGRRRKNAGDGWVA